MRDILLFTGTQITYKNCHIPIENAIKNAVKNGENGMMLTGKNRLYLTFSNERILDIDDEAMREEAEELQSRIPIHNAHITFLETYRSIDAKRVIAILVELFPDLYVNIDDSSDWFGSAKDFLEANFSY